MAARPVELVHIQGLFPKDSRSDLQQAGTEPTPGRHEQECTGPGAVYARVLFRGPSDRRAAPGMPSSD